MAKRKKILIISAVFPPEQVTSAYLNYDLAKRLSEDYSVVVLRPKPTRPIGACFSNDLWTDPDFETIQIDSYTNPQSQLIGRFKEAIDFSRKCNAYIRKNHTDIDFVYNDGWQLFGLYLIAKECRKYKIPYIVPIQDIYPESLFTGRKLPKSFDRLISYPLRCIDRYYQKHAAMVRTISAEMADYLAESRSIHRDKYLTINNWQNDEDFKEIPDHSRSDSLTFCYVGSLNEHANVDLIIKAFHEANLPNARLNIYGGGNQKAACEKLVTDIGADNIFFGYVSRKEIPEVQAKADALILALPKGNGTLCLPSKLTSYLLSGKPVIASVDAGSSTSNIIKHESCGIVVPPDDLNALRMAFIDFGNKSQTELAQMSQNSRSFAVANLTRETNLEKLLVTIKSVLNND